MQFRHHLLFCLILLTSMSLFSFDGKRQGFVLGGGLGISSDYFNIGYVDYDDGPNFKGNEVGLYSNFTIGYGIDNHLVLSFTRKASCFFLEDDDYMELIGNGINAFSGTYYFYLNSPTFITVGAGLSEWYEITDSILPTNFGFGFYAGAGIEMSKNIEMEMDVMIGFASGEQVDVTFTTVGVSLNYIAY